MDQIEKLYNDLDVVLDHLNNQDDDGYYKDQFQISKELNSKFTPLHVYHLCEKLDKDGLVSVGYDFTRVKVSQDSNATNKVYDKDKPKFLINYHGKEFFLLGGYRAKRKEEKLNKYWLIAKTAAATLNAIIIIVISAISLKVSNENSELKKEVFEKEKIILQQRKKL